MPLNISKMHSSKVLFHLWKSQGGIIWGHLMLAWHEALDDQRCEREHHLFVMQKSLIWAPQNRELRSNCTTQLLEHLYVKNSIDSLTLQYKFKMRKLTVIKKFHKTAPQSRSKWQQRERERKKKAAQQANETSYMDTARLIDGNDSVVHTPSACFDIHSPSTSVKWFLLPSPLS